MTSEVADEIRSRLEKEKGQAKTTPPAGVDADQVRDAAQGLKGCAHTPSDASEHAGITASHCAKQPEKETAPARN